MKKVINILIVLLMFFCVKVVNADTNIGVGDTKVFKNQSCVISQCVSNNSSVKVEFSQNECKYSGVSAGKAKVTITCSDNQTKIINVNVTDANNSNAGNVGTGNNSQNNGENVCSPLGKLKDDINGIFDAFKIVAPILVIAMSVFDFVKAVAGKVDEDLKKAFQKLLKRILFAAILFFLPVLLNWILGLVDPGYNTCINV